MKRLVHGRFLSWLDSTSFSFDRREREPKNRSLTSPTSSEEEIWRKRPRERVQFGMGLVDVTRLSCAAAPQSPVTSRSVASPPKIETGHHKSVTRLLLSLLRNGSEQQREGKCDCQFAQDNVAGEINGRWRNPNQISYGGKRLKKQTTRLALNQENRNKDNIKRRARRAAVVLNRRDNNLAVTVATK